MAWLQLIFECPSSEAETWSDLLSEYGAAAVTLGDAADQPLYEPPPGATPIWDRTRVIGLFPSEINVEEIVTLIGNDPTAPTTLPAWRAEALEDRDWNRAWMDGFKPLKFGKRLWIVPSWHEAPEPDAVNVLLDPGMAFGTGTHPTTQLCLEWLDSQQLNGKTIIDFGCGSGILGVAAAKLGATIVYGIDNDPQAIIASRENARRNDCADRFELFLPEQFDHVQADALVANILANPLMRLASQMAELVKPGAPFALSGILPEQADGVAECYRQWFRVDDIQELDGWIRIAGHKN